MRFKRLELVGFKSFAERTVIDFEAGVTAVVGPNGCGKSNISDAIRWVLGEQSAKSLRGSSMEDVIFNGSSAREALNFAEVSLTLSNEARVLAIDYDEVTISRRLYRSGESEYILNKNIVRLRDVHELLMGTGIGTESYSIIEQGKMDAILNSRPDERRLIFEEAAGITKFKSQKKEALRKLEQTDQNLLRVNDIIQEVKRQIGSIERQAKKAEVYKVEFEKLKNFELSVATHEFSLFENERQEKARRLEELSSGQIEKSVLAENLERAFSDKKTEVDRLDGGLKEAASQEMLLSGEIRRNQDRILLNRERMGELVERRENLLKQVEGARKRIEELVNELGSLSAQLESAQKEETAGQAFLQSAESEFGAIDHFSKTVEAEALTLRLRQEEIAARRLEAQSQLAQVRAEGTALENRLKRLREDESYHRVQADRLMAEVSEALSLIEAGDSNLVSKNQQLEAQKQDLEKVEALIGAAEASLDQALLEQSASGSKLDFLQDLKQKHEGFWGGVKALLAEKEAGSEVVRGMSGLLADLVQVQTGYEFAVEAALGSYLQAVVFENNEDVIRATDFLKTQKKGRALLVSLESDSHPLRRDAMAEISSQSILNFVSSDAPTQSLLQKLLAGIYVVEDIRAAFGLVKAHPGVVCVTLSGERVEGQVVAAGSNREDESYTLVGRQTRIREQEEALRAIEASIITLKQNLESQRQLRADAQSRISALSDEILKLRFELGEKKSHIRHSEESHKRMNENLQTILRELEELLAEEKTFAGRVQALESDFELSQSEETTLAARLVEIAESLKQKVVEREGLLVKLAEIRSMQSVFVARREKIEKDKLWVADSHKSQEELVAAYDREAEESRIKKEALELENTALSTELEQFSGQRDQVVRQLESLRLQREEALLELQAIEAQRLENQKLLEELRRKQHELEMENAQVGFAIDRLKERIFNAYQIDLLVQQDMAQTQAEAALVFDGQEPVSLEDARLVIQKQREKLQKMGPVNLVAIEEHTEMKARYEFLTQQEQDLIQAKEDLHKAILKINRTTKELFTETFAKVQQYFSEYFKLLFQGGQAELVLLDENDVLESGVEIVARPPGKKPQTISLLSGGEKALTATALMFSLFKVKPSPFCILDEIDAPLDETNVERFCNVLKEFIVGSQFILITHNKRTMNLADAMYGITMAQTGVSRVVSVKFSDRKELEVASNGAGEAKLVSSN